MQPACSHWHAGAHHCFPKSPALGLAGSSEKLARRGQQNAPGAECWVAGLHYGLSLKMSGEAVARCWTENFMNHFFFTSVWFDASLECIPKNLTSEAGLTLSNTSIWNKNCNQFKVGGHLLPRPNGLLRREKSHGKVISPKSQPREWVTVKHTACKCTCRHISNCFLTRSFSSVLVGCLQSGCQTVEPGKTQRMLRARAVGQSHVRTSGEGSEPFSSAPGSVGVLGPREPGPLQTPVWACFLKVVILGHRDH